MSCKASVCPLSSVASLAVMMVLLVGAASPAGDITLKPLGVYSAGIFGRSAAEISSYDTASQRLFVVNHAQGSIDVLNISRPDRPRHEFSLPVGDVTSVACSSGVVAAAVANADRTKPGSVWFFSAAMKAGGQPLKSVQVGALPDMVTFTPDGKKLLVANEGEPGTVDPDGSVSVIDLSSGVAAASVTTIGFDAFDADSLRSDGVRLFPGKTPSKDLEPEYICVTPDGATAFVSLQEANAVAKLDINRAAFTGILPLGSKDHRLAENAFDPSDRDNGVHIANWPVHSFYMPDSIASYTSGGRTYFVTANEGDARGEADRVCNLKIDPTAFPNRAELQRQEQLGRLQVSTIDGDTDGDGDFDQLYAYGTRSFSIWDAHGNLVFDSGSDFERITSMQLPTLFNAANQQQDFDSRSAAKGPEPEGVALATIEGCTYAFIGLERVGGIMIYDVTKPSEASFVDYVNSRMVGHVAKDLKDCDLGPEGILVIPASDSPTGDAMLVVTNEVSGTTTLYSIVNKSSATADDKKVAKNQ